MPTTSTYREVQEVKNRNPKEMYGDVLIDRTISRGPITLESDISQPPHATNLQEEGNRINITLSRMFQERHHQGETMVMLVKPCAPDPIHTQRLIKINEWNAGAGEGKHDNEKIKEPMKFNSWFWSMRKKAQFRKTISDGSRKIEGERICRCSSIKRRPLLWFPVLYQRTQTAVSLISEISKQQER